MARPNLRISHIATQRSRVGLDWLNFFLANVQTGFGPFVAVYLAGEKWTQVEIGSMLSLGTITALVSQLPAGALVDSLRDKRAAAAAGIIAIMLAALLFAIYPAQLAVAAAEILHGFASCVVGPAIAAISLSLVGINDMGERLGRNARFASIGNGFAAALMGVAGTWVSERSVFLLTALLTVPALLALGRIRRKHLVAAGPATGHAMAETAAGRRPMVRVLGPGLMAFALAAVLFHLSNAAQLPLAAVEITRNAGATASLVIASCIVVPQMVVALLSPTVGRRAEQWGRRPVLLLGFAALPLRAMLLAVAPEPWMVVVAQLLDGVSGAVFGVMMPLICADLTRGTGRFNLAQGLIGLAAGLGATLSTFAAGLVADRLGNLAAFSALAGAGLAAVLVVALFEPESRPERGRFKTSRASEGSAARAQAENVAGDQIDIARGQ